MDASEMPRRETPERGDGADAPVGRVGGRSPSTLSAGGGAPAAEPLAPGQRWSVARKRTQRRCIVVGTEGKRLTRGEAPLLARLNQIPPASETPPRASRSEGLGIS